MNFDPSAEKGIVGKHNVSDAFLMDGDRQLSTIFYVLDALKRQSYWEMSYIIAVLSGPVLWSVVIAGFIVNAFVIPVELIYTHCSSASILAASVSVVMILKGLLLLSLARQNISRFT